MSTLDDIRRAQMLAGEDAVIADLRRKGLVPHEPLSETEALRKDAERYRCLRDDMTHEHCGPFVGWTLDILLPGDDPDDAVDKRIRKKLGK